MPSEIETALYGEWADQVSSDGDVGEHSLLEFAISRDLASDSDVLRLVLAPNDRIYIDRVFATFRNACLGRIQQPDYDPSFDAFLPWCIAGFHSTDLGNGLWRFQLHSQVLRIQWSSAWPDVQRSG